MNRLRSRNLIVAGAACAAAGAIGVASWWGISQTSASDKSEAFVSASATARAAGDSPAAIVNGEVIPQSSVAGMLSLASVFPAQGIDPGDRSTVVGLLVRQTLLRQEAKRRGISASDDEVTQSIEQLQASYQGASLPEASQAVLDGLAKVGHPLQSWKSDPTMRAAIAAEITEAKLGRDETKDLPQPVSAETIKARMDALVSRLQSQATMTFSNP